MTDEERILRSQHYSVRGSLVHDLELDLLGPSAPDEVIVDPPITTYLIGVLYPQTGEAIDPSFDHDLIDEPDEGGSEDAAVSLAHVRYPSSVGMSFGVDPTGQGELEVEVSCGRYEQVDGVKADVVERPSRAKRPADADRPWRRVPVGSRVRLPIAEESGRRLPLIDGLELFFRSRRMNDSLAVTVALVNTNRAPAGSLEKDSLAFFQARIKVSFASETTSRFLERPIPGGLVEDSDVRSATLLYRHAKVYAVGHGAGVEWSVRGSAEDNVATSYIPRHELNLAVSNPDIDLRCLNLKFLGTGPRDEVVAALRELPGAYRSWIDDRQRDPIDLRDELTAQSHLEECALAASRIDAGIAILSQDDEVWNAFRLASQAMLTVRSRAEWFREGAVGEPDEDKPTWFPFQLAFMLLCLPGIVDPDYRASHEPDRDIVDLLWFPTGGGKTEAYLGLIAFTVFLRRSRHGRKGGGVASLMRYTLRLLTIQQFERAAALICACELMRREDEQRLGTEEISLGLWVGAGGTPNSRDEAPRQLKKLAAGAVIEKGNPVQLRACPWCRSALDENNYYLNRGRTRLVIACSDQHCHFARGLPVFVVDDDVYDHRPTLIIATADKFAGIAWRPQAHRLFNLDEPDTQPPELIIQDELHLIAGPLGTLAGLYEAAIDGAAASRGPRPKVIASTATIRRAEAQSRALFARGVRQFPPPGIDSRSSFFAVEASREDKGARLYVGLLAPGASQTTLLVRTYARLLQSASESRETSRARDPYWTLLGYFNSLRVLGGARMQVYNDVEDRLMLLEATDGTRRRVDEVIELTSRESSADIPGHLTRLAVPLPNPKTLDVVLATNMISVGVDVDRLGLMAVMGQPQGTAEYIQATSRVGRKFPGLVVVLFNGARSRDRSHYESFVGYHGSLYRQVESTSVTPYSPRARDRALHAALIASVRLRVPELRADDAAGAVEKHLPRVLEIRDELVERAAFVTGSGDEEVARQLDEIIERWRGRARENPRLKYRDKNAALALLVDAADPEVGDPESGRPFGTLWSLRDVDRASNLYLLR